MFYGFLWGPVLALLRRSLVLAALILTATTAVRAQGLVDIRLGTFDDRTRAVVEIDRALPYEAFTLSGPPRLVIDFTGLGIPAGFAPSKLRHGLIRDVRLGQFKADVTRVVMDLNESVRVANSFFLRPQGGYAYRVVLDLAPGQPAPDGVRVAQSDTKVAPASPDQTADCAGCETIPLPPRRPGSIVPQRYIIVIDPGHGGADPGAVGRGGVREADIVLEMAKEISNELRQTGAYDVYLTRGSDISVPLGERAELARGRAADFFLSIHANANPDPALQGFMVFTLSDEASDAYAEEVAARENSAELGSLADLEDEEVGQILGDIVFRDTLNQSIDFAARLVNTLRGELRLIRSPHRRAGFVVLKSLRMPSALLEIGHLTNSREANALQRRSHRRKIAIAVRRALDEHFANN